MIFSLTKPSSPLLSSICVTPHTPGGRAGEKKRKRGEKRRVSRQRKMRRGKGREIRSSSMPSRDKAGRQAGRGFFLSVCLSISCHPFSLSRSVQLRSAMEDTLSHFNNDVPLSLFLLLPDRPSTSLIQGQRETGRECWKEKRKQGKPCGI